jgi:murein DD-endopeptidase MepM/ murein hydrolase activator NlpD
MHTGVDLAANYGETVGASMSGRVAFAGVRGGYGNLVVVDHGLGIAT